MLSNWLLRLKINIQLHQVSLVASHYTSTVVGEENVDRNFCSNKTQWYCTINENFGEWIVDGKP